LEPFIPQLGHDAPAQCGRNRQPNSAGIRPKALFMELDTPEILDTQSHANQGNQDNQPSGSVTPIVGVTNDSLWSEETRAQYQFLFERFGGSPEGSQKTN
jgi:hypothetical protein